MIINFPREIQKLAIFTPHNTLLATEQLLATFKEDISP